MSWEPDPKTFKDPHKYATYLMHRNPKFKTHANLGTAKNAASGKTTRRGRTNGAKHKYVREMNCHVWFYEFDFDTGWTLVHHMPKGTILEDDEWYTTPQSKGVFAPTQAAVDGAIASIIGTTPS